MPSRFDPSAFIAAETQTLATIAAPATVCRSSTVGLKPAEICHSEGVPTPTIATIAGIAGVDPQHLVWRDAPSLFASVPRPVRLKKSQWHRMLQVTEWLAQDWGEKAIQTGWHPLEFFGCNPDPFAGRIDRDGVAAFLIKSSTPVEVVAVEPDHVELAYGGKDLLRYRPFGPRGQVYLWQAYSMDGGP